VCGLQTAFAAALHGATVKFGAQTSTANITPIGAVSRCWAKNLKIAPLNDKFSAACASCSAGGSQNWIQFLLVAKVYDLQQQNISRLPI